MTERQCSKCKVVKPIDAFSYRPDKGRYNGVCKTCIAARGRAWHAQKKESGEPVFKLRMYKSRAKKWTGTLHSATPPPPERVQTADEHRYGNPQRVVNGEIHRECKLCGAIEKTRPDGTVYGDDLTTRCDEVQRRDGYTPEFRAGEYRRILENVRYAEVCDSHWPSDNGMGYVEA
ncbi:MAG: hypothetical protein IT209_00640 [Armatimonadetes bacterium]|nr:hypothetical protein [Armatimonadota bacterium]